MPKRKNSAPVRAANASENWSWTTEKNNENAYETPVKKSRRRVPQLPIRYIFKYTATDEIYFVKSFVVGYTNNIIPTDWKKCQIICTEQLFKLNFDNLDNVVINLSCSFDHKLLNDLLGLKLFKFNINLNVDSQAVEISLYLYEPRRQNISPRICRIMQEIMVVFFNIDMSDVYEDINVKTHENMDEVYSAIKHLRESKVNYDDDINLQHSNLLPILRPYQHDAVKWMIGREKNTNLESLHLLYETIKLSSGTEIYYNKYTGYIDTIKPEVVTTNTGGILADEMGLGKTVEVLACILNNPRTDKFHINTSIDESILDESTSSNDLDETIPIIETQIKYARPKQTIQKNQLPKQMNTSKLGMLEARMETESQIMLREHMVYQQRNVESRGEIQCICGDFKEEDLVICQDCYKKQHAKCMGYTHKEDDYFCPKCWINQPLIKSRATLIVSPTAISRQWSLEIKRHIRKNGLKVLEYKGIHNAGMVYPTNLADYDIVITTYVILQSEMKFNNEEHTSLSVRLRHPKRYNIPNTPLCLIDWWRLCLDEAQFVECPFSTVSAMAKQLTAHFRWAVTGTPIQRHLQDLFGLVDYLHLSPYDDQSTWNYALYYPYLNGKKKPLIEFLSTVLWRTSKADVLNQVNIPEQKMEEHWLEFSALLLPLLSLRQACTHPYAVRGKYLTSKKQVNSMEELLDVLIKKNLSDCEESLRAVIASLNGMAGLLLLQQRHLEAVEKYREALTYMSKYAETDFMKIDKLQQIHTLYNLNEVLMMKVSPAPPPTLRDDKLKEECDSVQRQYMDKYISKTKTALQELQESTKLVKKFEDSLILEEGAWIPEVVFWLEDKQMEQELCRKVECLAAESRSKQKFLNIRSGREIMYFMTVWMDKVAKQLKIIRKSLEQLVSAFINDDDKNQSYISEEIVEQVMECHLRPAKTTTPKAQKANCVCCVLESNLKKYECMLFQMHGKQDQHMSNDGNWKPCFEDNVAKCLYTFTKLSKCQEDIKNDGNCYVKLLEARRKEFKALRKLYTYFDSQISAQDELNICKIRFRLRNREEPVKVIPKKVLALENLNYEIKNQFEFIHVMNEHELDINYNSLDAEKIANEEKLKKVLGTHSYLETLRKQQYAGQNPDPCPICQTQLQDSWSILQCGHCYCLHCIHQLLDQYRVSTKRVQCSVCRKKQLFSDISYIKVKGSSENTIDDIEIKGSYSTKIHAVTRCVLKLKQSDPNVKILIFSTWPNVLKAISDAFKTNEVEHEYVKTTNLQDQLQRFKDERFQVTALLLPIRFGANGLNLTEATHVLLVEPLMNPGEELQAIGRVHRIGQTKPTFVHRFVIKHTMEEKIHNAMATNRQQWEDNKLTLAELKKLFTESNLEEGT